jgi:cobalt-zinc-cadmium efflux system membrane fusion protein
MRTRQAALAENDIEISLFFRENAKTCATDGALIQFASATTAERSGIAIQTARSAAFEAATEAPAEITFDESSATVVTTTIPALVSRWMVSPGDIVKKGDVLAVLQSPEIAALRSTLVSANAAYHVQRKELERHKSLKDRDLVSDADLDRQQALTEQARAELVRARGMLLSAGLNQDDIDEVLKHGSLSNQFALRAQASGTLVERIAQLGELLDAGQAFAMLADPSAMWIEARLTEEQLRRVQKGQQLTFTSDGRGLHRVAGEVIWVSRFLDPHTRTGTVRARVLDPNHALQAGEFGRVEIHERESRNITLVPKDAVQWEGCCNVVFVREAIDRYRPRKVELHGSNGPFYQVAGGIEAGENIVVDGAFLLKTELKKTSIGAGCCGLDPAG